MGLNWHLIQSKRGILNPNSLADFAAIQVLGCPEEGDDSWISRMRTFLSLGLALTAWSFGKLGRAKV